jgi:hypothetical protein
MEGIVSFTGHGGKVPQHALTSKRLCQTDRSWKAWDRAVAANFFPDGFGQSQVRHSDSHCIAVYLALVRRLGSEIPAVLPVMLTFLLTAFRAICEHVRRRVNSLSRVAARNLFSGELLFLGNFLLDCQLAHHGELAGGDCHTVRLTFALCLCVRSLSFAGSFLGFRIVLTQPISSVQTPSRHEPV